MSGNVSGCSQQWVPCGLCGCKNRAHSMSWPEVVKGVPNQGVDCFVSRAVFLFFLCLQCMHCFVFLFFLCQYQCNRLLGKTRFWSDLLCVDWDVKPYTLTHSHQWIFPHDEGVTQCFHILECTILICEVFHKRYQSVLLSASVQCDFFDQVDFSSIINPPS